MCYPVSFVQTIQRLYFCEHKKVKEIAESLNCSTDTVTRIIKKDVRYEKEKESRRNNSKEKQNKLKKGKREEDNMLMEALKRQQEIHATVILSKKRKLGTDTLIEMSITHYDYDIHNKRLVFNEACGRKPADLPRTIKVHSSTLSQFVQYSQNIESEKWNSTVEKKALK